MPSPMHGVRAPFTLPSDIVYFHDWRYVHTGGFQWLSQEGEAVPTWGSDPVPPMRLDYEDMPSGVQLIAQRAEKSPPVLTAEEASETVLFGGTLIHEEGKYRFWYESWPSEQIGDQYMGMYNYLRYAESDDGVDWRFPSLGLIEHNGSRDNNIVYGGSLTPETGLHGGCVFRDSSAPPEERYKAFHLGFIGQEALDKCLKERPEAVDPFHRRFPEEKPQALFGAVSSDGFSWEALPDALVVQPSDTHNVCTYDQLRGKYVAYCRSWFYGRRTIGRMETDDFRRFPLPEELFWPNAMMQPCDTWYANAKTMMPGTQDYHVMFPLRWSLPNDRFDIHLATSPDGIVWGFVPGGPVCEPGDSGGWDAGVVAPGLGLVELPGDRIGILVAGSPVPHKYPRRPPLGKLAWAWWPKDRLVALQAPLEGSFALSPLIFKGRSVRLNFRTACAGYVKIEVVDQDGKTLPGRGFDDCDRLNGDHLSRPVTWRGRSDMGHTEGSPVSLRFRLRAAELYSVRFV